MSTSDGWHLQLAGGLILSFQRFAWPDGGIVVAAPLSLGALPVACSSPRSALLPLAEAEAFWIGVSLVERFDRVAIALAALRADGRAVDVVSGKMLADDEMAIAIVPPLRRIDGIPRGDGSYDVLGRAPDSKGPSCTRLTFRADAEMARVQHRDALDAQIDIVDYAAFERATGVTPAPLDPEAGYKGYRLP